MSKLAAFSVALFLVSAPLVERVEAAVTTFTDDALFKSSLGSFVVHGFDEFVLDEGPDVFGFSQALDQQIPGVDFDNARVNFGGFAGNSKSTPNVVLNADFVNPIEMNFSTPQFSIGLYNTSLVDAERFEIFDASNNLLGSIDLPSQVINFGGFLSDVGIIRATVTPITPTNGSIFIDDLILAVPEPTSALLLASGLLAFAGRRRSV